MFNGNECNLWQTQENNVIVNINDHLYYFEKVCNFMKMLLLLSILTETLVKQCCKNYRNGKHLNTHIEISDYTASKYIQAYTT